MSSLDRRIDLTFNFVEKGLKPGARILDLGVANKMGQAFTDRGYDVTNTSGEDLDEDQTALKQPYDAVTAFEILEHTLNPFAILKAIEADHLFASIPMSLWFSPAYRSKTDMRDRHFHEFEDWQFDWLLEKTGWEVVRREKWTNPTNKIGLRPLLRNFTKRWYIIEAKRTKK